MHASLLAAAALLLAGPEPAQDAADGLRAKDWQERKAAVDAVARSGDEKAEKLLIGALGDDDWEVREAAIRAMPELSGTSRSLDALIDEALDAPVRRMRRAAAQSLAAMDAEYATEELLKKVGGRDGRRAVEALYDVALVASAGMAIEDKQLRKLLLNKKDTSLRSEAARALFAAAGERRAEVAAELLVNEDLRVVCAILEALAEQPVPEWLGLIQPLIAGPALNDVVERRLVACFDALLAAGSEPLELGGLESALASGTGPRRVALLDACAERPKAHTGLAQTPLEQLIENLKGDGAETRALAARVLERRAGEDADNALLAALDSDEHPRVRLAGMRAFHRSRPIADDDAAALEQRAQLLAGRLADDPAPGPRLQAAVYLGSIASEAGPPALIAALDDEDWRTASAAAVSLGQTRVPAATPALLERLAVEDWRVRASAVVGLGRTVDKAAIEPLIGVLEDEDPAVVGSALAALRSASGRFKYGPDPKLWRDWWESEGQSKSLLDPARSLEERRKYGYEVPAAQIYAGLDVFVLQSRGDHIEKIFGRLEIEHQLTSDGRVFSELLHPDAVFVSNCTGEISQADAERLAWFLVCGGSVFGSCWALHETVERIYPGVIAKFETRQEVLDDVAATPLGDLEQNPFLRGAFSSDSVPIYRLEGAHLIEVLAPERCEVLLDSPEAAERHGCGNLAAWFDAGHGVVLDSVNHFDLQGLETAAGLKKPFERQAYAIDHMGLSYERWREIEGEKFWSSSQKAAQFVPDDSAFRFVTNFVRARRSGALEPAAAAAE